MADAKLLAARRHFETLFLRSFDDQNTLKEAFWAYPTVIDGKEVPEGNKKLAVIGDSAMDVVVARESYRAGMSRCTCELLCSETWLTYARHKR